LKLNLLLPESLINITLERFVALLVVNFGLDGENDHCGNQNRSQSREEGFDYFDLALLSG
jgi:hypothetical protein